VLQGISNFKGKGLIDRVFGSRRGEDVVVHLIASDIGTGERKGT
jgi:hypothetical protein